MNIIVFTLPTFCLHFVMSKWSVIRGITSKNRVFEMVQSKLNNCISQTRSALFRASDCERPCSTRLTVLHQLVDGPPLFNVLGCIIEKFDTFDVCIEQLLELLQSPRED